MARRGNDGPPDNRGPDSPGQQRADLQRLKYMMGLLPDMSIPLNPPPIMDPKVIIPPHEAPPPSVGRYLLAADGPTLAILDMHYGGVVACSVPGYRDQLEEMIRLANRPEQET